MADVLSVEAGPQVELGTSNLPKHPSFEELLQKALVGTLPRSRPLKSWEPEKLNPTSLQVVLLRAAGMRQRDIANFMNQTQGTTLNDSTVSIICNHPDARYLLTQLISYAADEVADIRTRIDAYAAESVEAAVSILRTTNDQRLKAKVAFEFLDRAGYNTVQKVEAKLQVVAPKTGLDNLSAALRETGAQIEDADYVIEPSEVLSGEGSGNALAISESPASGQVASEPPASTSPNPSELKLGDPDLEPEGEEILRKRVA